MSQQPTRPVFVAANFIQATCWHMPHLPQYGESCQALQVHTEAGGKGLNVTVGLARLKHQVSPLIGCGRDSPAEGLLRLLQQEGVDQRFVYQFEQAPSGQGGGFIDQHGNNMIAVALGANLLLTAEHGLACTATIAGCGLVYGQFETAISALEQVFQLALQHGVPAILNPSPWQQPTPAIQQSTHTLLLNGVEIQGLIPALQQDWQRLNTSAALRAPSSRQQLRQQYARTIQPHLASLFAAWHNLHCLIVTLGDAGCLAFQRVNDAVGKRSSGNPAFVCWTVAACSVEALDSVGAGDAFAAGYCAALLKGMPLPAALQQASICGAYMVSQRGVVNALPTVEQLTTFMLARQPPYIFQIAL